MIINQKIDQILKKYSHIQFECENDKTKMFDLVLKISNKLTTNEELNDFLKILEDSFVENSDFEHNILYNPLKLIDRLLDNDLLWKKIDNDELSEIINSFELFLNYYKQNLDTKKYLEDIYNIKILFIEKDWHELISWIFIKAVSDIQKIQALKNIKKLLFKYPIEYIRNIKLDNIIVANYFYRIDIYWARIVLGWFETSTDNNIYLSFSNLVNSFDHELYHQAMQYYDDSSEWESLRKKQDKFYIYDDLDKKVEWFARCYWMENISEDQATVAEDLLKNSYEIMTRCISDTILSKKVKLVKKAFFSLSEWIMNEEYFTKK